MSDLISRAAAIDMLMEILDRPNHAEFLYTDEICMALSAMPSTQPERLTDDDFETIRIHLSAYKNELCNQRRWKDAEEYERLIERFMAFAYADRPRWIPCSERLPSEIGTVIVTLLDEYGEYDVEEEWWTGDMFLNFGESSSGYEVLAWMPIPEPYKQDVRGGEHG